jgi:uncharacterized UBP type Zn finger protein
MARRDYQEHVKRLLANSAAQEKGCAHLAQVTEVTASADGCEECLKMGDSWVHLRLCLVCGHVGCCDHSKNKHATAHFHATGHPVVLSFEPGEDWVWCYADRALYFPEDLE